MPILAPGPSAAAAVLALECGDGHEIECEYGAMTPFYFEPPLNYSWSGTLHRVSKPGVFFF